MSKKMIVFFVGIIFFFGFNLAYADVVINEIQLSPTGERFLELYNTADSVVDLTGWYIQRKTATGSNFGSLVSNPNFEGKTIGVHDYFIISRNSLSSSDIVLDSLTLTESNTIQIKNSNEEVVDKVGWGNASDCGNPCPSNPPEGQSIQKTGTGSWVASAPTPGASNQTTTGSNTTNTTTNPNTDTSSTSTSSASTSSSSSSSKKIETPKIQVKIVTKSLTFAGTPFSLQGLAYGTDGGQLYYGKYFWNFGDGSSMEAENNASFLHIYFYSGEYSVSLEYSTNIYSNTPDAVAEMVIKVVPMTVSISRVGDATDFFIELSNNTDYEIDISKWILSSLSKTFVLPRNTIILAKGKMMLSPQITHFTFEDAKNLKLSTGTGQLVFNYSSSLTPATPEKITDKNSIQSVSLLNKPLEENTPISIPEEQIPTQDLSASVIENEATKNNFNNSYLPIFASFIFIGASAGAVYFIRQKKIVGNTGDDFNILNE